MCPREVNKTVDPSLRSCLAENPIVISCKPLLSSASYLFLSMMTFQAALSHENGQEHSHESESPILTTRSSAKTIAPVAPEDGFQFIVYGDRTGGVPAGLKVLEQAVEDTNLLDPDLVLTVGDLIQGYNETAEWLEQADEYKAIMNRLKMRWFPVAGNHDIYWRGKNPAPPGHHESNYEQHFGPLWYSFRHKNAGFIVLYSDEGDPNTNKKAFNVGLLQQMSKAQLEFLDQALKDLSGQDHVFVFLHHPRWIGGGYTGSNWDQVHRRLKEAGNVSAVFAGHIHRMRYDGTKDGIEYFALATTGGHIPDDLPIPGVGHLHHFNIVTVRPSRFTVSSLPVGAVFDPKQFTPEFLEEIAKARTIRPRQSSPNLLLSADGAVNGNMTVEVRNPAPKPVETTLYLSLDTLENDWTSTLDHRHLKLAPGQTEKIHFRLHRAADESARCKRPAITMNRRYLSENAAIDLPPISLPLGLKLDVVPADYFTATKNNVLIVNEESDAVAINNDAFELPQGPFTIETWVRPKAHPGYDAIIAKTESSEYAFFSDHGTAQFDVHLGGRYVTASASEPLATGKWSHLAGVFDGQNVTLFVNGKKVDSKPASGKRRTNAFPLYLGADPDRSGVATRGFVGQLDEFRLSKSVRYTEDFKPQSRFEPDDSTVLLHHFDRAVGPFLLDHSQSAANGNLGPTSRLVPHRN